MYNYSGRYRTVYGLTAEPIATPCLLVYRTGLSAASAVVCHTKILPPVKNPPPAMRPFAKISWTIFLARRALFTCRSCATSMTSVRPSAHLSVSLHATLVDYD